MITKNSERKRIYADTAFSTFTMLSEQAIRDGIVLPDGRANIAGTLEALVTAYAEGKLSIPVECLPGNKLLSEEDDQKWNR